MQATTSRVAVSGFRQAARTAVRDLPPCTCRFGSLSKSLSPQATENPRPAFQEGSQSTYPSRMNATRSHASRLADQEKRKTVLIRNLTPTAMPGDVRRLAKKWMGNDESIRDVIMLPSSTLRRTGRALVEFSSARDAVKFAETIRGKSGPGQREGVLDAFLADSTRMPHSETLRNRIPLSLQPHSFHVEPDGRYNLRPSLAYSGRAVLISGFPPKIAPLRILQQLRKDGFQAIKAPGIGRSANVYDEIVSVVPWKNTAPKDAPTSTYLVRLPTVAEAHRLVSEWQATWPSWAKMDGEFQISTEIVW